MPNQRLMNCDFFLKGAFDNVSSNKAKLLYFYLFINADDLGFVGNASKIIKDLNDGDMEENGLVQYTFENAADDLINKGFLYRFTDKHQNQILLIRHFFIHNKYNGKYCKTNYLSLRAKVELIDNCWELKENHIKKENNANNTNNVNNANNSNDNGSNGIDDLEDINEDNFLDMFQENKNEDGTVDNSDYILGLNKPKEN